jgi:hypothetical protein
MPSDIPLKRTAARKKSVPIATLITDICAKLLSNHGNLRPDGSVTLLHDEEGTINDLMSSLGADR